LSADLLELAASLLGDLTGELVFVGGASIHLWLSDPAAPAVRSTDDVDAIGDAVICRWRHADSGLTLDMMPTDEAILGFSNPWYPLALATAVERRLPSGTVIRAASPPLILATKLAAWEGRGSGDLLGSLDVHDVIVLADGRSELAGERAAATRLRLEQMVVTST